MCFDRRVLIGFGVVAGGVLLVDPRLLGAALPLLCLAACPLSMVLMMRGTRGRAGMHCETGQNETRTREVEADSRAMEMAELREELTRLRAEVRLRDASHQE